MFSRLRQWRVPEWLVYAMLALVGGSFCFLWIERAPLFEWDEARHAVNAWEMRHHGDPFNYTFAGEPDRWNAKPQLLVWLIRVGYEVIGPRELAVRWASALAAFALGLVVYRLHRLFFTRAWALFGAIIVFTMRGLVGYRGSGKGKAPAHAFMLRPPGTDGERAPGSLALRNWPREVTCRSSNGAGRASEKLVAIGGDGPILVTLE